jgi:hypothetical protein
LKPASIARIMISFSLAAPANAVEITIQHGRIFTMPEHPLKPLTRNSSIAALAIALVLPALPVLSGCVADARSEFTIAGIQRHRQCLGEASPVRPAVNAARVDADTVGLFFQSDARLPTAGDTIYIQIYRPDLIRANLGEPIELADPRILDVGDEAFEKPPVARAMAIFAESCPEVTETFGVLGTVVFEELGGEDGDPVKGRLLDAQIISLRDDALVAGEVSGTWDFIIDTRRPFQYFPAESGRMPDDLLP